MCHSSNCFLSLVGNFSTVSLTTSDWSARQWIYILYVPCNLLCQDDFQSFENSTFFKLVCFQMHGVYSLRDCLTLLCWLLYLNWEKISRYDVMNMCWWRAMCCGFGDSWNKICIVTGNFLLRDYIPHTSIFGIQNGLGCGSNSIIFFRRFYPSAQPFAALTV